jgi:hypothetical protein
MWPDHLGRIPGSANRIGKRGTGGVDRDRGIVALDQRHQKERAKKERRTNMVGQVIGIISCVMLLLELGVVGTYFGGMSVLMLLGPVFKRTDLLIAWLVHVAAAILCYVSFAGVVFCYTGTISPTSFVKWLLFTISVLGVLPLPLVIYNGVDDAWITFMAYFLAGWGVILLITTLIAFRHMESR